MALNTKFVSILIVMTLIVVILANIELYINKKRCAISLTLSKNSDILMPEKTGFADPIYIYNSKKMKRKELNYLPGYDENKYVKKKLDEHVASKISRPFKELTKTLASIPKSKTPINAIYSSMGKSGEIINTIDPLSYNSFSNYKMLTSIRDNAEAFVSENKVYII